MNKFPFCQVDSSVRMRNSLCSSLSARIRLEPFVNDVEHSVAIKRDVVRRLPSKLLRQLRPHVLYFVLMLANANNRLPVGLLRRHNRRHRQRHGGTGRCCVQTLGTGRLRSLKTEPKKDYYRGYRELRVLKSKGNKRYQRNGTWHLGSFDTFFNPGVSE